MRVLQFIHVATSDEISTILSRASESFGQIPSNDVEPYRRNCNEIPAKLEIASFSYMPTAGATRILCIDPTASTHRTATAGPHIENGSATCRWEKSGPRRRASISEGV